MRKKNLLFIFTLFIFSTFISWNLKEFHHSSEFDDINTIRSSQVTQNYTIVTFLPKVIWVECHLQLGITSNQTGSINCYFRETSSMFSTYNNSFNIIDNNLTQEFNIFSYPLINTLPGVYRFRLNISGFINYFEEFKVIFSSGLVPSILLFSLSLGLILYISIKKSKKKETVKEVSDLDSHDPSKGKIKCPNCRKEILEGLTFCPECGERIPEFLRYNPVSNT